MGLNMTYRDTQSQVQPKKKASHVSAIIVDRGSIYYIMNYNIN